MGIDKSNFKKIEKRAFGTGKRKIPDHLLKISIGKELGKNPPRNTIEFNRHHLEKFNETLKTGTLDFYMDETTLVLSPGNGSGSKISSRITPNGRRLTSVTLPKNLVEALKKAPGTYIPRGCYFVGEDFCVDLRQLVQT